jgi:superfamily I DNA/RNA helicase
MPRRDFFIKESELDDYQVKVLQKRVDKPNIIKGCAGSGKSILALHRVKQIQEENIGSFYFILYTRALKQYMQDGIDSIGLRSDNVTYHWNWKNKLNAPNADYIIIDEAQDFSEQDIKLFKSKANKALMLFGDSAQQIYKFKNPEPISMEQIAVLTGIPSMDLMFNHRLPKKIARLAEKITDSDDELEFRCKNEGVEMPKILQFNSLNEQLDKIIEIVGNRQFDDVGILFRKNADVQFAKSYFDRKGFKVESKINRDMDIDFESSNPKLTTYHSSKGLQFEAIFIPNCTVSDEDDRSPLYVAITRTYQSLFIMHSGNLSSFFNQVPTGLYETSLISKPSRRL